jgi:hypothetical protein
MVSIGDSVEGCWTFPEDPTWRLTTVPVSSQAAKNGFQ